MKALLRGLPRTPEGIGPVHLLRIAKPTSAVSAGRFARPSPSVRRMTAQTFAGWLTRAVHTSAPPSYERRIERLRAGENLKAHALTLSRILPPSRAVDGPDDSLVLYFFGADVLASGAHARHVSVTFDPEGACLAFVDKFLGTSRVDDLDLGRERALDQAATEITAFLETDGAREG